MILMKTVKKLTRKIKIDDMTQEEFIKKKATKDTLYEIFMRVVRENVKLREENQHLKEYIEIMGKDINKEEEKKPPEMIITWFK